MRRFETTALGIAQGDVEVFSEFEAGGPMWTGAGDRERRRWVAFDTRFKTRPIVHVGLSLIDVDSSVNFRCDAHADRVQDTGFDLVFRTWGDSRVARIRMSWIAMGALPHADDWDV